MKWNLRRTTFIISFLVEYLLYKLGYSEYLKYDFCENKPPLATNCGFILGWDTSLLHGLSAYNTIKIEN